MGSSSSPALTISSEIVVATIMFLFVTIAFVVFLYVYTRYRWGSGSATHQARVHQDLAPNTMVALAPCPGHGLDPEVLRSLPVRVFKKEDFKEAMECSVCLSEIADGEKTRLLPKCNHGFHLDCIDMWFHSHSTCPLCRNPVEAIPGDGYPSELRNLPTNVLFWGSQDRVSAGGGGLEETNESSSSSSTSSSSSSATTVEGVLVIDIPSRTVGEEMKSPAATAATPASTTLRSFKKLLSREKKVVVGSPCSTCGGDVDRGTAEE